VRAVEGCIEVIEVTQTQDEEHGNENKEISLVFCVEAIVVTKKTTAYSFGDPKPKAARKPE
jgi:hypothetical protein